TGRGVSTPHRSGILPGPPGEPSIFSDLSRHASPDAVGKPMPSADELETWPFYNGHSVGHFDGDTLVIETAGFNEKTFLDASGAPHTDEMTTLERIRKISPTQLEDVVTIHDPQYYTHDCQARFVYTLRSDIRIEDYNCGEPHRDLSSVAGVRRP